MQYEEFVLRQLKRNEKIYSVCMKVFLVFMIVFGADRDPDRRSGDRDDDF